MLAPARAEPRSAGPSRPGDTGAIGREQDPDRLWAERCLGMYRQLHQQPELSGREYRTARVVAGRLRSLGFRVHENVGGTGVVGTLGNGDGPAVMLRAELDGLPVAEHTGLTYASGAQGMVGGRMQPVSHACGHDVHMAALLAAVEKLVAARQNWSGTLIALFQPAEETGVGAQGMLDDGVAELVGRPTVLLAQHTSAMPAGVVTLRSGPVTSAGANMDVRFHGRGGHAAYALLGANPAEAAGRAIGLLEGRFMDAPDLKLTVGTMSAGTGHNMVPDMATLGLGLRATDERRMRGLIEEVTNVVAEAAARQAGGQKPEIRMLGDFPVLENDTDAAALVQAELGRRGLSVYWQAEQAWACEDLGTLARGLESPVVYWFLGVTDPAMFTDADLDTLKAGGIPPRIPANHSGRFAPHPTAVVQGAVAMERAALAFLGAGR